MVLRCATPLYRSTEGYHIGPGSSRAFALALIPRCLLQDPAALMSGAANGYVAGQIYYDAIMVSTHSSMLWGFSTLVIVAVPQATHTRAGSCAKTALGFKVSGQAKSEGPGFLLLN